MNRRLPKDQQLEGLSPADVIFADLAMRLRTERIINPEKKSRHDAGAPLALDPLLAALGRGSIRAWVYDDSERKLTELRRDQLFGNSWNGWESMESGIFHASESSPLSPHTGQHLLLSYHDYREWLRRQRRFLDPQEIAAQVLDLAKSAECQSSTPSAFADKPNYRSPFITMMLAACEQFSISESNWPKREELEIHFKGQKLPDGTTISSRQAAAMAMLCRPPEAMKGGNKRTG